MSAIGWGNDCTQVKLSHKPGLPGLNCGGWQYDKCNFTYFTYYKKLSWLSPSKQCTYCGSQQDLSKQNTGPVEHSCMLLTWLLLLQHGLANIGLCSFCTSLMSLSLTLCSLLTPGLSWNIQCHVHPYSFPMLAVTRSDIRPLIKWAASLVIADGPFNLAQGFVLVFIGKQTHFIIPEGWAGLIQRQHRHYYNKFPYNKFPYCFPDEQNSFVSISLIIVNSSTQVRPFDAILSSGEWKAQDKTDIITIWTLAVFFSSSPSCPAIAIQMGWTTWAIWSAIKKYSLSVISNPMTICKHT